jgi:hypothetical protein
MRCPFIPYGFTTTLLAVVTSVGGGGCSPYQDFNADPDGRLGPIDPVLFPPANMGVGGDRKRPGRGRFFELNAYVNELPVGYFSYALPTVPTGTDPLRVLEDGQPYEPVPTPPAYVFDGSADSPFPANDRYQCAPPPGYSYVPQRDDVDYSKQGAIFARLPQATYAEGALPATSYVPVVAEARLGSNGLACQQVKSVTRIQEVMGMIPATTGQYLAWLVIDPSAPVYPRENPTGVLPDGRMLSGLGLQKWGWYNRFLLAYLDGGYLPTAEQMVMGTVAGAPAMIKVTRMQSQRLFVPRQVATDMGMAAGRPGAGYDVIEFKRGETGYSPLCQVWNYGDPTMPVAVADLPRSVSSIMSAAGPTPAAATPASYVFCLQVR